MMCFLFFNKRSVGDGSPVPFSLCGVICIHYYSRPINVVMFDESVAINNYAKGDTFRLSAKGLFGMDGYIFEDAVILE